MSEDVSTFRLYLLRAFYLLLSIFLGFNAWSAILRQEEPWEPLPGVAFSFWAALSTLAILGIRYPLKMLPLLLLQLFYKLVWLIAVALPLSSLGRSTGMTRIFVMGVIGDLIVIPWPYVVAHYLKNRGDRWR